MDRLSKVLHVVWSRTTRRMQMTFILAVFLLIVFQASVPAIQTKIQKVDIPRVHVEYGADAPPPTPYNASKVALLIENRPMPVNAPLMLHFMAVLPPEWRFRFMGSTESVAHLNKSSAIREQVDIGKLDLTFIPSNMSTDGQEMISRFLTNLWLYETVLQPAEWLLMFQTDSILCANSKHNINDYLDYDWIGAPWHPEARYGGNGGLSLRRVSAIIEILRDQVRADGSEPEDVWLAERLGHRPGAKMANGMTSLTFSGEQFSGPGEHVNTDTAAKYNSTAVAAENGEYVPGIDDWRDGNYEPMGYHIGGSGDGLSMGVWAKEAQRKHIWNYCPEVKMTLRMDAAEYVPGSCYANWKRDLSGGAVDQGAAYGQTGSVAVRDVGHGTEIIDGVEYPILPANLVPW